MCACSYYYICTFTFVKKIVSYHVAGAFLWLFPPILTPISISPIAYIIYRFLRIWVGHPSMSVNETSVTGYSCMHAYTFSNRYTEDGGPNRVQLALREAESTSSSWQYKTVLTYSCDFGCYDLWHSNFSNSLIGSGTFTNLKPNTLYTVVTFPCYWNEYRYIKGRRRQPPCIIDYARYKSPKVNISTSPLGRCTCMCIIRS